MGFKSSSSAALFLSLNLFFIACALAYAPNYYNTPDIPDTPASYPPKPTPSPVNPAPFYPEHTPTLTIPAPFYPTPTLTPSNPALSNLGQPTPSLSKCSRDTLKLGACAKLLNGPIDVVIGRGTSKPCCTLIDGLIDTQVAVCLCTALKANILGIKLDVNIALSVLVNTCGKKIPPGFKCA